MTLFTFAFLGFAALLIASALLPRWTWKERAASTAFVLGVLLLGAAVPTLAQDLSPITDPAVSIAPLADPSAPSAGFDYSLIALVVLIVVESAKRLAAAIPGKKADEFEGYLGTAELFIRKLVDFLAGRGKHPEDQSAVKHE